MPTEIIESIGKKISEARHARGLNQGDLALKLNKTKQAVSAWETGTSQIPITELDRVANVLGVPIAFFFGDAKVDEIVEIQKLFPAVQHLFRDATRQYQAIQRKLIPLELQSIDTYYYPNSDEPEIDIKNSEAKTHFWITYDVAVNKQFRLSLTTTIKLQEGYFVNRAMPEEDYLIDRDRLDE